MSLFSSERPRPTRDGDDGPRIVINVSNLPSLSDSQGGPARVNVRALIILGVLLVLVPALYFPLSIYQRGRLRRAALDQARAQAEAGNLDLAVIHLNHHLGAWPEDVEALEMKADYLTRSARGPDEVMRAASVQDALLRLDPMGPGRQDNRRCLVELYLRYGEWLRFMSTRDELRTDRFQNRCRAAVKIAQQRIAFGADDAAAHRLLAMALESLAAAGDSRAMGDAVIEYEKALRRDAGDEIAAERLALIHLEKRNDRAGADELLDELAQAKPDSARVRLARHRYFLKTARLDRATAELEAALKLAPTDPEVRFAAAGDALRRGDPASARRHLDVLSRDDRGGRRQLLLRGQIELAEQHPERAIEAWRKGLAALGGGDKELVWQLAMTLIHLGRFAEAGPLVDHFRRLAGDDSSPMARLLMGIFKERTGHVAAAIVDLELARASVGPEWAVELSMTLGRCFEAMNDDVRAMAEFRKAQDASPLASSPRRAIGRVLGRTDPEAADAGLEAGIKVVSDPLPLMIDQANLRLARQLALPPARRDWGPVEAALARLDKVAPDDGETPKLRADYLANSGRADESLALLEKAARGFARHREDYWLGWSRSLAARGRVDEALKVLEEGSDPSAAGDHASFRAARARLLIRSGRARAARELLVTATDKVPPFERASLARAHAEVLHELGDHDGARDACVAWSKLAPGDPQPGLTLLALAQQGGGDEAARLGADLLRDVGGEDEPYPLAARALDLLLSNRAREETRSARIEQADRLVERLLVIAPQLGVSHLLRGIVLERKRRTEEAIASYRMAVRGNASAMALPRLVGLYTRLKRYSDLDDLKSLVADPALVDKLATNASMDVGDKDRAQQFVGQLVESQPDSLEMRSAQVKLLGELGKPREAEQALRSLADRRPDQPGPWLALVVIQASQGHKDDAARTIQLAQEGYAGTRADLLLARCRWVVGDRAAAAELYEGAVADRPSDPASLKEASEFFEATGRLDRVEALLRQAVDADPKAAWARRRLALLLASRPGSWSRGWSLIAPGGPGSGEGPDDRLARAGVLERSPDPGPRAEAVATLAALADDLPATHPIGVEARLRLARKHLDADRPGEAAKVLGPVVDESSSPGPALLAESVEALARSGHADEAARQLARLVAAEPNSTRIVACRAWVFLARGKKADAAATVEDALAGAEGKPDEEAVGLAAFQFLGRLDLPEAAERVARRVAARRPRDAWMLARHLASRGRMADALAACRVAIEAGNPRESLGILLTLAASRRLDPAQLALAGNLADEALAGAPKDLGLIGLVAPIRHFQGRFEEEIALYRLGLELDPGNATRLNDLAWVLSENLNRPDEGLGRIDDAIRRAGPSPQFSDTRGVILGRLGRSEEAIQELDRAVKGRPSAVYYYHLARAAFKGGRPDLHALNRDLARKAGLDPSKLDDGERADYAAVMAP